MKIIITQLVTLYFIIRFHVIRLMNLSNIQIKAKYFRSYKITNQKLEKQDPKVILSNLSQKKETKASTNGEKLKTSNCRNKVTRIRFKSFTKIKLLKIRNKMIINNKYIKMKYKINLINLISIITKINNLFKFQRL